MNTQRQSQYHRHHSEDDHASDKVGAGGHDTSGHGNHNGFEAAGERNDPRDVVRIITLSRAT